MKKGIIFWVSILVLSIPVVLHTFKWVEIEKLNGNQIAPDTSSLRMESWLDGTYQTQLEKEIAFNLYIRPTLIRLQNQLLYSIFGKTRTYVSIGQKQYLWTWDYFQSYAGFNFKGSNEIEAKVAKIDSCRNWLKSLGKELVVVIAPNKARIFPEFLPKVYQKKTFKDSCIQDVMLRSLKEKGIPTIDFNPPFKSYKKNKEHQVFSSCGIHWSAYGAALAEDSLNTFLNDSLKFNIPKRTWDSLVVEERGSRGEIDLMEDLNLLFEWDCGTLVKPNFQRSEKGEKPNVLALSDSFYWSWYSNNYPQSCFSQTSSFWFYNRTSFNQSWKGTPIEELDLWENIKDRDLIIMLSVEPNLDTFPYGFIDDLMPFVRADKKL